MMSLWVWALWGFLGAFVYAAPRLSVAIGEAKAGGEQDITKHLIEFAISLTFGPIFATAGGEWVADHLGRTALAELRGLAFVIGLTANPVAPVLVKAISGDILGRIGAVFKGDSGNVG